MARPTPLSGFPEWLPAQRLVEQHCLDSLRRTFELHGFVPVETRAVEPLAQMLRKGEIDKEVYLLRRLHAEPDEEESADDAPDRRLGLHFDLTVPFARYVLENAGHLQFPFRRYQVQKVWRGERPQEGRYREFSQADIDIVDAGSLAAHHEVEVLVVMAEALARLPLPPVAMQVNNRKLIEGFYRGLQIGDTGAVMRLVDKLDKIGPDAVHGRLVQALGLPPTAADAVLRLAGVRCADESFVERVHELGVSDPLLDEGLAELATVVRGACGAAGPAVAVWADLRIARGLDYYTGTVYETQMTGFEHLGSVCSGGRYDSLASDGRTTYPGVGISFGVTRALAPLFSRGLTASRPTPTCVLVAVASEEQRPDADAVAALLRRRGIATEVSPTAAKYGRQIRYADRRGIPFVWFGAGGPGGQQVKDIRSGEQRDADPQRWAPPEADRHPRVLPLEAG